MPQRLQAMHEELAIILTACGSAFAAIAAFIADIPASNGFSGQAIYDDERFRLICIAGALGGALVNLWLWPSPTPGIVPMARQVSCSSFTGVVATPIVVHWIGLTPNTDNLLATSFIMAVVSVGVLKAAAPVWQRMILSKLGINSSDVSPKCVPPPAATPVNPPPTNPPTTHE